MQPAADAHQGAMGQYLARHGGSFTEQAGRPLTGAPTMDFRKWYTGQNLEGPGNGWDTDFQRVFQTQLNESYKRGDLFDFFTRDQATGVVTWDNAKGRNDQRLTFGDVVVNGERVGNVYKDFDRHTANVMMGEYLVQTGDRKRQLNEERDFQKAWEEEIAQYRARNTQQAEVAPRAKEFEKNVREELETDPDRGGVVAGGVAGGAVLGAGIGSFIPGVGTAIGGVVGGVVGGAIGGLGAWLNSDSLTYQLARSQEQLKLAKEEGAGIQATLSMVAQNTMSIGFSPLQNILQGTYDALGPGGVGGGTLGGEFQKVNDEGERVASGVWQAANLVALIGDSALQFASPAGRLAYQAQMTAQIGSGVIGLLPGQGMWDERLLRQNSVWTRDEYNAETGEWEQKFDLGNSLAGIGFVAIDAVQLGAWSSLSRANDVLGAQIAKRTGESGSRFLKPLGWSPFEKVNLSPAQRKALKAGGSLETRSGYKFVINDAGEIVGKQRMTLAMLAPSEGLQALTAKAIARRDAARRAGAVSAEDLYQAASDLALGQRGLQAMLVNAVGEGQEEALQAILEPWSQDHAVDAQEVLQAGLAGAAAGFGMTAGARLGRPSQDLQMYAAARLSHALQTNGEQLSFDEWNQMSHLQKRTMVKSAGLAKSLTDGAFQKIEKDRIDRVVGGVIEAAALEDYYRAEEEVTLKRGVTATDQAAPIVMHESYTFRPDALATSHTQLQTNQADATRGARLQLEELDKRIANAAAAAKKDPSNTKLAEREAQLRATRQSLQGIVEQSARLEQTIDMYVEAIDDAFERGDNATAESIIDGLNASLEAMYDMTESSAELAVDGQIQVVPLTDEEMFSLSRAVGRIATRDPADSSGSWQSMLPQVHKVFALRKADGIYGVSQIILKPIRGDYDGDKIRILNQLVVDDEDYVALRAGENVLGAAVMPEIASTKFEQAIATRAMQVWHLDSQPMGQAARKIALDIEASLKERYHNETTGRKPIGLDVISDVTKAVQEALATGGDIRETVLSIMSARAGGVLQQIGRGLYAGPGQPKLSNETYWIANMVTRHLQTFQSFYAEHSPKRGYRTPGSGSWTRARRRPTSGAAPRCGGRPPADGDAAMPGSHKFRISELHYTLWRRRRTQAGGGPRRPPVQELVEHYEPQPGVISQRLSACRRPTRSSARPGTGWSRAPSTRSRCSVSACTSSATWR